MKLLFLFILCFVGSPSLWADFVLRNGQRVTVVVSPKESDVVFTALEIFSKDYAKVFQSEVKTQRLFGNVYVGTIGLNSRAEKLAGKREVAQLRGKREGFLWLVKGNRLIVLGNDKRGTAFGLLEISRLMGVSPWEWWADSHVEEKTVLRLDNGFRKTHAPSVKHRGIFLNDEGWGLMPWSSMNYEASDIPGRIGPKTHARIFELLLRLRANTIWPAMHATTVSFYLTPGNKEMADKYGIFVGTSHCEPMMRNTNAEWRHFGVGEYNFVTNRDNVLKFWEERVKLLAGSDNIYTIGIRGVHDGPMQGARTAAEQKKVLDEVFAEQRKMIAKHVNPVVEEVSQVFIPYKEVLDVYELGLQVPDDVTLMWTDDNYGYIRHFPNSVERARKGGSGVYNHVSYWGRPHDYLWLATNHPALVYTQQKFAYDTGARNIWVVNVGDIKPAEYLTELFMDIAWDIHSIENNEAGLEKHLRNFMAREFGESLADELVTLKNEYYRLAYIRKPEFMGNTRTEERDPAWRIVSDLPWSESFIRQRIKEYKILNDKVIAISSNIPEAKKSTWFQLVEYPVRASAAMNFKHLYGQLARHGKAEWKQSDEAYDEIVRLTQQYNNLSDGKWRLMMDHRPRRLAVYDRVPQVQATTPLVAEPTYVTVMNGADYQSYQGLTPVKHGLGYARKAVSVAPNTSLQYTFETTEADTLHITVALVPNHPIEGDHIRYAIALNDETPQILNYRTRGRSEEWKVNVLTNQATRTTQHVAAKDGKQRLTITALDKGVMVDQIRIINNNQNK